MNHKNIKNDSFGYAKTGIIDSQKCLNGTSEAVLYKRECPEREKRQERAGVRLRHDSGSPCGAKAVFGIPAVYFSRFLARKLKKQYT